MSTTDPNNLPPALSAGGSAPASPTPPTPSPTASTEPAPDDALDAEEEDTAPKPKVDYGQKLVENKYKVLGLLAFLFLAGMGLWYMSLTNEMATAAPPSPVASDLNTLTQAPKPDAAPEPIDGAEQSLERDRRVETPDEGVMLTDGSASGPTPEKPQTPAEKADYRAQMAHVAHANNTDSMTVTERDPRTGQFVQKRVPVQRVAVATSPPHAPRRNRYIGNQPAQPNYYTGPTNGGFNAVTPGNQNNYASSQPRERPRPKYDSDGTPFETNDEINLMIASLPDEVKATYEKMSGKRYRPLLASQMQQSGGNSAQQRRAEMAFIPGMDGFNTIRYRGLGSGQGQEEEEEAPIPDIFYRCSVQGDQVVKTGTVVVLRLTEDATFNGITFPRNMIFSAIASVDPNRVNLTIDRLGPHRVKVQTYNYAYMPGIMIDPGKREPVQGQSFTGGMQQSGTQELSNAIAQSQQAANSLTGIAGRMAVTMIGRIPKSGTKLRQVALPDGYPLLLSKAQTGTGGAGGLRQGGVMAPSGVMGQEGNPFQSLLMSGQGQGGYQGNQGVVPPIYYPVDQAVDQARRMAPQVGTQVGRALGGR